MGSEVVIYSTVPRSGLVFIAVESSFYFRFGFKQYYFV